MHQVENFLSEFFVKHPVSGKIFIAFSGGLDSMCLLHAANKISSNLSGQHQNPEQLFAVHVNHQLQPEANDWEAFCKKQARQYDVAFHALKIKIKNPESNIEAQARDQRYQAISKLMQPEDALLTAHHLDDQAETVLLQLIRGAGMDGISGMQPVSNFQTINIYRPFLDISRQELEEYARSNDLEWVEDPSNNEDKYSRNFIRNRVIPLLSERWPAVSKILARTATNLGEANELVGVQSQADLTFCEGKHDHSLSIKKLQQFSRARQNYLLRQWFIKCNFLPPEREQISHIFSEIIEAREDATPLLKTADWQLRRFQDFLYLLPAFLPQNPDEIVVHPDQLTLQAIELPYPVGRLEFTFQKDFSIAGDLLKIKFRSEGDAFKLFNRAGTKKLKKLYQEWQIPPWMRSYVPLIYYKNECVAIADFARCESEYSEALSYLSWQPPKELDWRLNSQE